MKEPQLSSFWWNEVVFRSFQAGYLKRIDMELFRRLRSPIAKRLYRLLDKRFYHKDRWTFDLRELACEHVGISRNYDVGQMKRKLRPAIAELEEAQYLVRLETARRFSRIGVGRWTVCFVKESAREERRYRFSPGSSKAKRRARQAASTPTEDRQTKRPRRDAERCSRIKAYLARLSPDERTQLEEKAFASAGSLLKSGHDRALQRNNPSMAGVYRRIILEAHITTILENRST
jgi:hypothetical protein